MASQLQPAELCTGNSSVAMLLKKKSLKKVIYFGMERKNERKKERKKEVLSFQEGPHTGYAPAPI